MVETQGTNPETEGVVEPTQLKEEPTEKVYNEKDYQKAVSKGLESITRQLDLRKTETDSAKAEAGQFKAEQEVLNSEIQDLKSEIETLTQAIEDPDVKTGILSKRALAESKREVAKLEAEARNKLYEAEKLAWSARMAQKASGLVTETGIDVKELEDCHTEEEMEVKALRFLMANPKNESDEEKPPKFAGGGSGGGTNLNELSGTELIRRGVQRMERK